MTKIITTTIVTLLIVTGCATTEQNQPKPQENGPIVGAGQQQRSEAQNAADMMTTFVGAHGTVMKELGEIKTSNRQVMSELGDVKTGLGDIKGTNRQALETAQRSLQLIEEMSKRQGTGEITIFFPIKSAAINKNSMELQRLVQFADFLSRESKGRKIILLSIGSASSVGSRKTNLRLAKKRSETPLDVLDKYLVNIPHEFYKVYGTGDLYSPKSVPKKEHQRYQHTRIIALFDASQAPAVNEEATPPKTN